MNDISSDDIFLLKQRLAEQEALIHALQEKLSNREREIDHLQAQLDKLRRMNFGSRSEKVSRRIAQMEADLNRLQKESDTLTGRVYDPAVQRPLRQTRTRKPFPESLPRDEKRLLPAAPCCPNCGGSLSYLGEDIAEQLELMRSAFRVIRTVREKHACTQCDAIVQAPAPSRPIERGIAGPGLLARVLTSKYAEHTPLYRQSEIYGRQGVELSRSLLSGWVDACCRLLSPLEEALHGYVMTDGKLHADDTPVQVLLPGNKKTKTGRLWAYVRDDRNADGSVGTKNLLGITTSVHCMADVEDYVVKIIERDLLPKYLSIDGVVDLNHLYSCGVAINVPAAVVPIRTIHNIALNPNFGGEVMVVGMQCGGSDAFSGVTTNPAVGYDSDLLVRCGATVMFSEVTEVRDAIHLLTPRAINEEVGRRLLEEMA